MRFLPLFFVCLFLPSTVQASIVRTTPLIQAVQSKHMRLLIQLIRGGNEINAIDAWGRTATHYAVSMNNQEALKLLLDHGADANLADNDGNTPLDMWPVHENKEMLALLHAAGAKPLDLWQAAANNDRLSAERLLTAGADAKAENAAGNTAFDVAVESGHDALAAILLKAVAGINGRDEKSWTPLHWAIVADDWDLVRELIEAGADISLGSQQDALEIAKLMNSETKLIEVFIDAKGVDAIVRDGRTVLIYAAWNGSTEVVKLLIDNGADLNHKNNFGGTALIYAAYKGDTELVKLLIDSGADQNIKDRYGQTALMLAVGNEHTETVELLIDNGADPNIKNTMGDHALLVAVNRGHTEIVELLINNKADPSSKTNGGETALMLAARRRDTEIVKILVNSGADINIKSYDNGTTALIEAAYKGDTELVKPLIDNGADLNIKDSFGYTALMFAVREGNTEIVKLLLDNKADISGEINYQKEVMYPEDYKNNELMSAAEKGYTEIVELLIDNGADLNTRSKSGKTALDIAEQKGHQDIVDILRTAQQGSM